MHQLVEREEKWSVDSDFTLPAMGDLVENAAVDADTVELESVYYDTPGRDLRAHGIVARRRDGDDDSGWQLKLPTAEGRLEIRWPLTDTAPEELTRILRGVALGKELTDVATIRTSRTRHRVSLSGHLQFEIADDTVRASSGTDLLAWREIEIELGPGVSNVPKKLRRRLRAAGAAPSAHSSKLAHATGVVVPTTPSTAADTLTDYLNEQVDQIIIGDVNLRRGHDPIHDTRVAIRRLRSTLRVFAQVLDDGAADIESDLKWFAALLGDVRDSQVQQQRFADAVDALPQELVLGPVHARIRSDLQAVELPARTVVEEAMQSERYLDMLAVLRQWRHRMPIPEGVTVKSLRAQARKADRKADRRLTQALLSEDPDLLHRARKAAKRARYGAELIESVEPSAGRRRKRHKKVQSILGEHQDSIVAIDVLRRLALAAGTTPGENGFTFGLLYAREEALTKDSREAARALHT